MLPTVSALVIEALSLAAVMLQVGAVLRTNKIIMLLIQGNNLHIPVPIAPALVNNFFSNATAVLYLRENCIYQL